MRPLVGRWVVLVDPPEAVRLADERSSVFGPRAAVVAQQEDQVGADGGVTVKVEVAAAPGTGHAGIDELDFRQVNQQFGSPRSLISDMGLAQAVLAVEEETSQAEAPV